MTMKTIKVAEATNTQLDWLVVGQQARRGRRGAERAVMTPAQARRLRRMIKRFATAERELSWIGAQDPADHANIKLEHRLAKHALDTYIHHLTVKEK